MAGASQEVGVSKIIKGLVGFTALRYLLFLLPRVGLPIFFIYLFCMAWVNLGPQKPVVNVVRQRAADRAAEKAMCEIRAHRGSLTNVKMYHFANDPTDCLTLKFRDLLNKNGVLNLSDTSFAEKFRHFANFREHGCESLTEAVQAAKGEDVDGVLWGVIDRFESVGNGVLLKGMYQLVEIPSGAVIYEGKLFENSITQAVIDSAASEAESPGCMKETVDAVEVAASQVRWHIRFLWFVLFALLLPVVTISFLRTMVAKRSNKVNAFVLSTYTLVDLVLAFFTVGGAFTSIFTVLLFFAAGLAAFAYNVALMNFALKLEDS